MRGALAESVDGIPETVDLRIGELPALRTSKRAKAPSVCPTASSDGWLEEKSTEETPAEVTCSEGFGAPSACKHTTQLCSDCVNMFAGMERRT